MKGDFWRTTINAIYIVSCAFILFMLVISNKSREHVQANTAGPEMGPKVVNVQVQARGLTLHN